MKITVKQLKRLIRETLYDAYRTKGGKRTGDPVRVDADNTRSAGEEAAKQFGGNTDPFTVDVQPVDASDQHDAGSLEQKIVHTMKHIASYDKSLVYYEEKTGNSPNVRIVYGITQMVGMMPNVYCKFNRASKPALVLTDVASIAFTRWQTDDEQAMLDALEAISYVQTRTLSAQIHSIINYVMTKYKSDAFFKKFTKI